MAAVLYEIEEKSIKMTSEVFYMVGNQDIDDSDGGTTWIANSCYEYWKKILDQAADELRKAGFKNELYIYGKMPGWKLIHRLDNGYRKAGKST